MNKRALLGLEVIVQLIIVAFVIFSIYYAEMKFLSTQNIEIQKESRRLSLLTEATQLISGDFQLSYKEINYSVLIKDNNFVVKKDGKTFENSLVNFKNSKFSCNVESQKISDTDENIVYNNPLLVFEKKDGELFCKKG